LVGGGELVLISGCCWLVAGKAAVVSVWRNSEREEREHPEPKRMVLTCFKVLGHESLVLKNPEEKVKPR